MQRPLKKRFAPLKGLMYPVPATEIAHGERYVEPFQREVTKRLLKLENKAWRAECKRHGFKCTSWTWTNFCRQHHTVWLSNNILRFVVLSTQIRQTTPSAKVRHTDATSGTNKLARRAPDTRQCKKRTSWTWSDHIVHHHMDWLSRVAKGTTMHIEDPTTLTTTLMVWLSRAHGTPHNTYYNTSNNICYVILDAAKDHRDTGFKKIPDLV